MVNQKGHKTIKRFDLLSRLCLNLISLSTYLGFSVDILASSGCLTLRPVLYGFVATFKVAKSLVILLLIFLVIFFVWVIAKLALSLPYSRLSISCIFQITWNKTSSVRIMTILYTLNSISLFQVKLCSSSQSTDNILY